MLRLFKPAAALLALALLGGCAGPQKNLDYTAFKAARPHSILVLPPVNESPDVTATYSMMSQVTFPLAEAGYYVMPVGLVDETFKQNGLNNAAEISQVPAPKLRSIFGADAALYVKVTDYGTKYMVLSSATVVTATASLVDLKTGTTLWTGAASDSDRKSVV